jgi:hypothetical protein
MSALGVMTENPALGKALLLAATKLGEPSLETLELLHRAVAEDRGLAVTRGRRINRLARCGSISIPAES